MVVHQQIVAQSLLVVGSGFDMSWPQVCVSSLCFSVKHACAIFETSASDMLKTKMKHGPDIDLVICC